MQNKTINNALLELRKQTIRGGLDGLTHVEALLTLRGVDMPRVMPAKRADVAGKGQMSRLVLQALSERPMTLPELAAWVAARRSVVEPERVYYMCSNVLWKLQRKGKVRREGRVWRVQDFGPDGCLRKIP